MDVFINSQITKTNQGKQGICTEKNLYKVHYEQNLNII